MSKVTKGRIEMVGDSVLVNFAKGLAMAGRLYPFERGQGRVTQWPLIKRSCGLLPDEVVIRTRSGVLVKIAPKDYLGRRLFLFGEHEPRNLRTLLNLARGKSVFWDIGANYGLFSLELKSAYPELKVVAVEPQPLLQRMFTESIILNSLTDVQLLGCAIGAEQGTVELSVPTESLAVATTTARKSGALNFSVEMRTLDGMLDEFGPPDLIKLDIEGAEVEAIAGGTRLFSEHRPNILMEVNSARGLPVKSDPAVSRLIALGYSIFEFEAGSMVRCNMDEPLRFGHDIVAMGG